MIDQTLGGHAYTDTCAPKLIERKAQQCPEAAALIYKDRSITYAELNSASNLLAAAIQRLKSGNKTFIGICMRNSPGAVVAALAVFKAGCAILPLDPDCPPSRMPFMLADSMTSLVIVSPDLVKRIPPSSANVIETNEELDRACSPNSPNLQQETTLQDLAFLIYTSGSSGQPKGVLRTHGALNSRLAWAAVSSDAVHTLNISLAYGFSQERLFVPLMLGLPLAVIGSAAAQDPSTFSELLFQYGVTDLTLVPGSLKQLLTADSRVLSQLKNLRTIAVGSAMLASDSARLFRERLPWVTLINAYGSAETGSVIRGKVEGRLASWNVPIGRPLCNVETYIVDETLNDVAHGEAGELLVSAPSIAKGYLNQPELTASHFIEKSFNEKIYRFYRTGDIARILPNGEIELLGRQDNQVKVRGFRVELEEVEAVIVDHTSVKSAAVAASLRNGETRLTGYLVAEPGRKPPSVPELQRFMRDVVPEHMVPHAFVILESLPLTPNGKIDRKSLPAQGHDRPDLSVEYVPAQNELQAALIRIWCEILGIEPIGIHDNYLELGGDSLSLVQVAAALDEQLGLRPPLRTLLDALTVAELSEALMLGAK